MIILYEQVFSIPFKCKSTMFYVVFYTFSYTHDSENRTGSGGHVPVDEGETCCEIILTSREENEEGRKEGRKDTYAN